MKNSIILSIYIATYNRKDIIKEKIQELLSIESDEFSIWVLDDKSSDGTYEALKKIDDVRLHIIQNKERKGNLKDGVMKNWYTLLEECDGIFAFHLNDRDIIKLDEIKGLIDYLKKHTNYSGGICSELFRIKEYSTPIEAFYNVPYKGSHPTGIVFNLEKYKKLENREELFTKEVAYIHPHDLILGLLSQDGQMFLYKKIWSLPEQSSFADNKSFLYKKGDVHSSWFSPKERMKEFELFLSALNDLSFKRRVKLKKVKKVAKSYLYFCTFNYAYYISDVGQTQHYGIQPKILSPEELIFEMKEFLDKSYSLLKGKCLVGNQFIYKAKMLIYFWCIYFVRPVWMQIKKKIKNG